MKRILNILNKMGGVIGEGKAIYIVYFIVIVFSLNFIFYIGKGYIDIYSLVMSLKVMCILGVYKYMLGISITHERIVKNQSNIIQKIYEKLNEYVLKENTGIIKPIYYILYYFPTNGPYLIVLGIGRKGGDIRLYINSNKDIIGKKYFNKDLLYNKSLLDTKYFRFVKIYIIDMIFKFSYLLLYFKISLLAREGGDFFKYRIFGIIYSTVLVMNNMHIFVGFRNTEMINNGQKIIIVVGIIYMFLYYFEKIVKLLSKNVAVVELYLGETEKESDKEKEKKVMYKTLGIDFERYLEEKTMTHYYYMKDYLIFMSLAEKYHSFIDYYYRGYISKNINRSNINLPSNFIRVGYHVNTELLSNNAFFSYYKKFFDKNEFNNNIVNVYGMCEKNYRISFFLYTFLIKSNFGDVYEQCLRNYQVCKTFYGEEVINEYFKDELEEIDSLVFIYGIWISGLAGDIEMVEILIKISKKEYFDVPNFIKSNKEYKKLLELSNFFIYYKINMLPRMEFNEIFDSEIEKKINFISIDSDKGKVQQNNDVNEYIAICMVQEDQVIENPGIKYRIENFIKHDFFSILKDKQQNIGKFHEGIEDKSVKNMINILSKLQDDHKKKYFSKKPIGNKSNDFLEKYDMKEEGKFFSKKNKDMFN